MEISKELLSEVLGSPLSYLNISCDNKCEVRHSTMFENYQEGVAYTYLYGNQETRFMSKYEVAFKLKIWAYSNCCELVSYTEGCEIFQTQLGETIKYFYAETEVEAIILASEWILKEINEKQLQH